MDDRRVLQIGDARVTMVTSAYLRAKPSEFIDLPAGQSTLAAAFAAPVVLPIFCVHIAMARISLLLDASVETSAPASDDLPALPQPPGIMARLAESGVHGPDITHVVLTHGHDDHISGLCQDRDGRSVPLFPNAHHYFGRAEWEDNGIQQGLADPKSVTARMLGTVEAAGLLVLTEGSVDLGNGVQIIAAPGETKGHQVLRVHSRGETAYCLGDLFHFSFEFEHEHLHARWKDPVALAESRKEIVQRILTDDAVCIGTHLPAPGRLVRTAGGTRWQPI